MLDRWLEPVFPAFILPYRWALSIRWLNFRWMMPISSALGVWKSLNTRVRTGHDGTGVGFFTQHRDLVRMRVRMAYVLKREDLAKALTVLSKALEAYPGRML